LNEVKDILKDGEVRGRKVAITTMNDVREKMNFG